MTTEDIIEMVKDENGVFVRDDYREDFYAYGSYMYSMSRTDFKRAIFSALYSNPVGEEIFKP